MNNELFDCLIIGAGPCGISAGIELKNKGQNVAIIEKSTPGGKINVAPRVDNYPGHKEIPGPDLAYIFYERLLSNNIPLIGDEVQSLEKNGNLFKITTKTQVFSAKTVLIASGTNERKLELDGEKKFFGHGLSYCAICDGHFFKNKDVLVIGGGNSALKEAIYLTSLVSHLYLIHRRAEFRGNEKLVNELKQHQNVTILTPYIPTKLIGEDVLSGVEIENKNTNEKITLNVSGVFPLIGQIPNSDFVNIEEVRDEKGTIPVNKNHETSCEGLFAGGDILPRDIRQIYLSEHDGKITAQSIIEYLSR